MIYDDLTILIYRNIIKNNNNPTAFKSVTTALKIGTSSPIPDRMLIYDDLTILMCSNIIKNNNYLCFDQITKNMEYLHNTYFTHICGGKT